MASSALLPIGPQWSERPQWYVKPILTSPALGVELRTDSDAPFRATGIALMVFDPSGNPLGQSGNIGINIRFARPDGAWVQKTLVSGQLLNPYDADAQAGAVGQPPAAFSYFSPFSTNVFFPAGSAIQIDVSDLANFFREAAAVYVVFIGTKIFPAGTVWAPGYPAKFSRRPFFGYSVQVPVSQIPANNVPFNVAPDADFVWEYGAQTDAPDGRLLVSYPDPPDITAPPVLIDTAVTESAQKTFPNPYFQGPFKVGANLYVVLESSVAPLTVNVFKSSDGGLTWVQKDTVNSPGFNQAAGLCRFQAVLSPSGTVITIGFNPDGSFAPATVRFVTFDTGTDTFSVGVIPDFVEASPGLDGFDFAVRSNGEIVLYYAKVNAPNVSQNDIGFRVLSAGVWGAYQVVQAGDDAAQTGYELPAVVIDPGGAIVHTFYCSNHLVVGDHFLNDNYAQVSGGNVVSGNQVLSARGANDRPNYGRPLVWNGTTLALPVYQTTGGGGSFTMQVYLGVGLAVPVFSVTTLDSGATQLFDNEAGQVMVEGAQLWAVWTFFPDHGTIQVRRSINKGGGWGPINTFYDLIANPPNALPPASQGIFGLTVGQIGSVGAVITVFDAANANLVSYFLLQSAPKFGHHYFEQRSTPAPPLAPEITTQASFNPEGNQVDTPGPWPDGSNRWSILFDANTLVVRAYKSIDGGNTWAESDAPGAPTVADDSVAPGFFEFYGTVRDSRPAVRKVYVILWDTDHTVTLVPFDMSTGLWGAKVKSVLGYLNTDVEHDSGFTVAFRASDNAVVVGLDNETILAGGVRYDRSNFAKVLVDTGVWDAAWTRIGTTDDTAVLDWMVQGAVIDDQNRVHFQFQVTDLNLGPGGDDGRLFHQMLDGAVLSVSDQVVDVPAALLMGDYFTRPLARPIPAGGTELIYSWFSTVPTVAPKVARGIAGAAPAWSVETPIAALPAGQSIIGSSLVNGIAGQVSLVYWQLDPVAATATLLFVSNAGPGQPWTAPAALGTSTAAALRTNAGASMLSAAFALGGFGVWRGLGVRIRDWSGKYYMNDFIPAELIFGFDNSGTPGLLYPEIYIPKNQALYLDLKALAPIPVGAGGVTLTFKGQKIYS